MFKGNDAGYMWGRTHTTPWPNSLSIVADYATAMLKGPNDGTFKLKGGSAQEGKLTTMWDGPRKQGYSPRKLQGAIVLGNGGDGSDGGAGTFFEGVMTIGNPPDSVDDLVQANIVAAGYGRKVAIEDTVPIEPFKETLAIPGKIEVENYDKGENGRGFLDTDIENENAIYRKDNAGLDSADGAIVYGYVYEGDWLRYSVKVTSSDTLDVIARVASAGDSGQFSILIDDKSIASVLVPNTDDWKKFETVQTTIAPLANGTHTLKIKVDRPYFNLDWLEFKKHEATDAIRPSFSRQSTHTNYIVFDIQGNKITSFKTNDFHSGWEKQKANLPHGMYVIKANNKIFRMTKTK